VGIALINAVLVSAVVVPTVLWLFDCRLSDLYRLPNGDHHPVFTILCWLLAAAAVLADISEIGFQVQLLGESELRLFWLLLLVLALIWFRVLSLIIRKRWNVFHFRLWRLLAALSALAVGLGIVKALSPLREIDLSTFYSIALVLVLVLVQLLIACRSVQIALAASLFSLGLLLAMAFVIGLVAGNTWIVYPPNVTWINWLWPALFWVLALMVFLRTPQTA
jgi:hypothetical protein